MGPGWRDYRGLLFANVTIVLGRVLQMLPPRVACVLQNLFFLVIRSRVRFHWDRDSQLFYAKENENKRYFHDILRGADCYALGLKTRGEILFNSYNLGLVDFAPDDIVIDCGANYADLYIKLGQYIASNNFYAIEPSPNEARCIAQSLPDIHLKRMGLADKKGTMQFYTSSTSADSSVIEPERFDDIISIDVTTLDDLVSDLGIGHCKLLKLEAEGFEAEILKGASKFLKSCDYIAVDGGAERGKSSQPTLPDVSNILYVYGFEMVALAPAQTRVLFRRQRD